MRIVISNLPDAVTQDEIRQALADVAPVEAITLVQEGGAPTAVIVLETTRDYANSVAKRIQGRVYKGRELSAWVPSRDW